MRVAACQLNSRADRAANFAAARALLKQAAAQGADLAVLPEYVDYLGPARSAPAAEPVDGEFGQFFAAAARDLGIWVLAGSYRESGPGDGRSFNTSLLFDRSGRLVTSYRKVHLYDVEIPGRVSFQESATVAGGNHSVVVDVEGVGVGLSICYDLRFPELYRSLAIDGARVILVPAAFMAYTGRDHWEVLLRARAIEDQCFVVAAAQIGDHEPERTCYGRSMIIDPWGTVIAQAPDIACVVVAELDLARLHTIRAELPSLRNRRFELRPWSADRK
jgi:deaminated glutathione amidase